jgi:uncharacterized protein YjbI with pentapeptide repeats
MSEVQTVDVTGALPSGSFAFAPPRPRADSGGLDATFYQFTGVTANEVEFSLDEVTVHIFASGLDRCVFRQDPHKTKAHRKAFSHSYSVALLGGDGDARSVYRDCVFDHVDFGLRGGGVLPTGATFERCTFKFCAFRDFDARNADFIDCTFIGTITSARFHGQVPDDAEASPRTNVFSGNDFTRAKLRRVEYFGVDLRSSRLPTGAEYLRIDDFLAKAQQVRPMLAALPSEDSEDAEWLLSLYEERWSEPFFQWRDALAAPESPLWPLLESLV